MNGRLKSVISSEKTDVTEPAGKGCNNLNRHTALFPEKVLCVSTAHCSVCLLTKAVGIFIIQYAVGAVAHLGERLNGIQEVESSILFSSTSKHYQMPSISNGTDVDGICVTCQFRGVSWKKSENSIQRYNS